MEHSNYGLYPHIKTQQCTQTSHTKTKRIKVLHTYTHIRRERGEGERYFPCIEIPFAINCIIAYL